MANLLTSILSSFSRHSVYYAHWRYRASRIHSLRIDKYTFVASDDLRTISNADLMTARSSLTTLDIDEHVSDADMPNYTDIVQGASQLQHLGFNTGRCLKDIGETIYLLPLAPGLLFANRPPSTVRGRHPLLAQQ